MKKVVFLGNPNVGKSALINALSNSNIQVGNWPGVTTEMLSAKTVHKGVEIELLDLPGIYYFGNVTEEKITTDYLLNTDYDLIINVIDGMNLQRNLYLTLLARELQKPMLILLNFDDDVKKSGMVIDVKKLERFLQIPIFKTSAIKKTGIDETLDYIASDFKTEVKYNIFYKKEIDKKIADIYNILKNDNIEPPKFGLHFLAFRLFEKSEEFYQYVNDDTLNKVNEIANSYTLDENQSNYSQMQNAIYSQISNILKVIIDKHGVSRFKFTKVLDRFFLHKYLGLPIFALLSIYFLSIVFNVSDPLIGWIDSFMSDYVGYNIGVLISGMPNWFQSLMIDGVIAGAGTILTFTPLMYLIYLLMAILEESGAMARIAFLMDRIMRSLGLTGKSFISIVVGFGCTVPAIASTKTIEGDRARKATAFMLPFISCGARLPVYALFGAAFFSKHFALMVASLYILGILVAISVGLVLKYIGYYEEESQRSAFTIELPPYRFPTLKLLFKNVNNRLKGFLKRVVTLIMIIIIGIWGLNYFPSGKQEESFLARATTFIQPIFIPAGFGESKEAVAAIPTAFAAKEAIVATIGSLQGINKEPSNERPKESYLSYHIISLKDAIISSAKGLLPLGLFNLFDADASINDLDQENINKSKQLFTGEDASLKAFSYLVFILLLVPCITATATIKSEFGTKFMIQVLILTTIIPYVMSVLIFQIGRLILF